MENYSYSSYPDSGNSSPRSREVECDNSSWDEPPPSSTNYKVKFMCSYGGKIHPRPHDHQLAYVGGDTKIVSVDRNIRFSAIMPKLSSLCDSSDLCFKYQLPGEDLDALISVTNDEDLEHMMLEYDRLHKASNKPARLRLFLFPLNAKSSFGSEDSNSKPDGQWFVDALNSVQIQNPDSSLPPAAADSETNPDFLFGLDKGGIVPPQTAKLQDQSAPAPALKEKEIRPGSDCGSEDRPVLGEQMVSPAEIQRQIQELQRLQIAAQEQVMINRKNNEEALSRAYARDFTAQKIPDKVAPPPSAAVPVAVPIPAAYWPERHIAAGAYPVTAAAGGTEPPIYLIPTPATVFQPQTLRPVTGQVNQAYCGMQRVVPEAYREPTPTVYGGVPVQPKVGTYTAMTGMGVAETGYAQVGYDSAGRAVYYAAAGGAVVPPYQTPATTVTAPGGEARIEPRG
ncbi:PB1 domain [Dillenia turbinata]|uniref:PB1 domain n=1 Tax=Dillenia turbinata TaxID=194707 RepID=A0AAN8W6V6_9MAGN